MSLGNLQSAPNAGKIYITQEAHLKKKRLSPPMRVLQMSLNLDLSNETSIAAWNLLDEGLERLWVSFWISAQDCRHASMWWNGQDWGRVCGRKDASHGSTSRYAYPYRPQVAEQTCCILKLMRLGSLRAHFWTVRPTCARLWGLWGWGSFSYA